MNLPKTLFQKPKDQATKGKPIVDIMVGKMKGGKMPGKMKGGKKC